MDANMERLRSDSDSESCSQNESDSNIINDGRGCLSLLGETFAYFWVIMMLLLLAPVIFFLFLVWCVVALVSELLFPGRNICSVKKIWTSMSKWVKDKLNISLNGAAFGAVIVMLVTSLFGGQSSNSD